MKSVLRIIMVFMVVLLLSGCGSKKRVVTKKRNSKHKTERVVVGNKNANDNNKGNQPIPMPSSNANISEIYIATYADIAKNNMRTHKIPASITLAQGILESGSGRARLAVQANNHFGIKCHDWTGGKIYHDDDASQECFRKYKHAAQSFEDHSAFLTGRGRYSTLFDLRIDDYKGWARGLRAAGYATDRKYPDKLISLIDRFQLYRLDQEVLGKSASTQAPTAIATDLTHRVIPGDTLYSLSKRYNLSVTELQRLNEMSSFDLQVGQVLIIKNN